VEQGPPDALLSSGGPFARLFAEETVQVG